MFSFLWPCVFLFVNCLFKPLAHIYFGMSIFFLLLFEFVR